MVRRYMASVVWGDRRSYVEGERLRWADSLDPFTFFVSYIGDEIGDIGSKHC